MKILFVDDEPTLSEALQAKMEARGFQCVSRNDMTSALAYMQEEAVAAVVTDIMMPAGDDFPSIDSSETGFFFVKKLRKEFPGVGVVCLSVIGDQRKINELKKLNVLYLGKATRLSRLQRSLSNPRRRDYTLNEKGIDPRGRQVFCPRA